MKKDPKNLEKDFKALVRRLFEMEPIKGHADEIWGFHLLADSGTPVSAAPKDHLLSYPSRNSHRVDELFLFTERFLKLIQFLPNILVLLIKNTTR